MSNTPKVVFKCHGQGQPGDVCTSGSEIDASHIYLLSPSKTII